MCREINGEVVADWDKQRNYRVFCNKINNNFKIKVGRTNKQINNKTHNL